MARRALTRRLRTLVVSPSGVLGGAESWLLSALDSTDRLDVEVILLADGPLRAALDARGIPVTVRPVGRRPQDLAGATRWLRRELRRRDPDVAVGNGIKAQVVLAPAARATGVPSVWAKHDHSYDRKLAPWLARTATRVVATAGAVAVAAGRADTVVIEPPRPVDPLPRPDATEELATLAARPSGPVWTAAATQGRPEPGTLILAMLGRFVPYKGIDTAIRALAQPGGERWTLVAIGGDEPNRPQERQRLASLAHVLGVADRVRLCPFIPDASRLLAGADALAVLTRPDGPRTPGREGFGMSALEAMVAGVPVIGIADGGPIDTRVAPDEHGRAAGITIPPDDATAVARALADLADPATRRSLGAEGQRRAASHHDATTMAARFAAVLAEAACRPGAGLVDAPAISVVSPVLDEASNIDRLIGPISAQLGPDDEYLLVDGASTDGTIGLIEAWSARDPRIRLIRSPGGTIANSRNRGIAAARNSFIACTDAGCDPGPNWVAGFRAAAAEHAAEVRIFEGAGAPPTLKSPKVGEGVTGADLYVGVYRAGIRAGKPFEQAMAAVSWPDPVELRRPTPFRTLYGKLFGRAFSPRRVDGRSVGFTRAAWTAAGGFPENLKTAEDEAFGRAVLATGARSALTLDAEVTWHQRGTVAATFQQFRGYGRGGGSSRSPLLLGRDAVRVLAYAGLGFAAVKGGVPGKVLAAAGAAAYLSLPVSRVVRRGQSPLVLPLLPAALLLKDVAKVLGTAESLLRRPPRAKKPVRPRHGPRRTAGQHLHAGTATRTESAPQEPGR